MQAILYLLDSSRYTNSLHGVRACVDKKKTNKKNNKQTNKKKKNKKKHTHMSN